jgi:hypothetical protein
VLSSVSRQPQSETSIFLTHERRQVGGRDHNRLFLIDFTAMARPLHFMRQDGSSTWQKQPK